LWHRLETTNAKKTICSYEKKNSSVNKKIFFLWFNRFFVVATFCSILYAVFFNIKNWRLSAWQIKQTRYWFNRDILWSMKTELMNWFSSINWQQYLISFLSWEIFSFSSFFLFSACVDVSRISSHKKEAHVWAFVVDDRRCNSKIAQWKRVERRNNQSIRFVSFSYAWRKNFSILSSFCAALFS
jgi:magnesium-transporting ATPase (P-type)